MTAQDVIVLGLERTLGLIQFTLADFTDAEMFTRPAPGANHAAWQVGHLAASEASFVATLGGKAAALPAGFAERFTGKTTGEDDPARLGAKAELLDALAKVRASTIAWVKGLTAADLDTPMPEKWQQFAKTAGDLANMVSVHASMHLGQLQVIRRKLGKKVLF